MMEQFTTIATNTFFALPEALRYLGIFAFSFTEGVPILGSILPGGTIALLAGSLSAQGYVVSWLSALIIAVASFGGDMTGFFIIRRFRTNKWLMKHIGTDSKATAWEFFDRNLAIIIIFGKLIPIVRSTPALIAALRGVSVTRYVLYSALGSMLWAFAGIYGGKVLAELVGSYSLLIILGLLVIGIITFIVKKFFGKKETKDNL